MKKIIPSMLIFLAFIATTRLNAQSCGGVSNCIPSGAVSSGFDNSNNLPCVVQDSAYNNVLQFTMYSMFNAPGVGVVTVDSIKFVAINNLPCGICWAANKASLTYTANEVGCLSFMGTSADSTGQYRLQLQLIAWTNGQMVNVDTALVNSADLTPYPYVRVRHQDAACDTVNQNETSSTSAGAHCVTAGINEVLQDVSTMTIVPNPMSSSSILTFTSVISSSYTLRISNIAGQELSAKEIKATAGTNSITLQRNNLAAGIYLVTLSNGHASLTRKLTILE